MAGLLVVGVLVATGCGGGSGEVSEPATTIQAPATTIQAPATTIQAPATTTQAPATTTQAPATTTQAPTTTRGSASTTTAATTSTLPTVSTVEIELSDASAEVEGVTIGLEAEVHIQVGGFKPFSEVTIELRFDLVQLVVTVADADGWIDVTATIPVETDVGGHEIHISGIDASDEPVEILIPAEIVEVAPTVTGPAPSTTGAPSEVIGDLVVTETGHPLMVDVDVAALVEDGGPIELTVSELGSVTTAPTTRTVSVLSNGGKARLRGLRAETTYEVATTGTARYRGEFITGPLPDGLPPITTELLDLVAMAPGYTLFNLLDLREELGDDGELDPVRPAGWLLIVDEIGEVVWYHNQDHTIGDARFLEDGTILFEYNDTGGRRINLDGDLLDEWAGSIITGRFLIDAQGRQVIGDTPIVVETDAMHHEQHRLPDGTHVTLSAELRVLDGFDTPQCGEDPAAFDGTYHLIGDVVVIFDPVTGEILNEFSMFSYFDPRDDPASYNLCGLTFPWVFPNWLYKGVDPLARDWTHANAVEVDEASNALIVSIRHLDALLALRWTDDAEGPAGEVLWQSGQLGDLTLANGSWHLYQHAPEVQDDGTILVYDNGNRRPGFGTSENPNFSRVVLYSIDGDAKTADQLWEFRSSLNDQPAFAGFVGDADRLSNGNVLITDGGLNGAIDGVTSAQIVEVVPFGSDGGDIVWRLAVEGGAGWVVYRSERLAGVFD